MEMLPEGLDDFMQPLKDLIKNRLAELKPFGDEVWDEDLITGLVIKERLIKSI
jgi:hypothetical protein